MAKIKICLDAGHYGKYNRSPAILEYYESEMNWKLHLKLTAELEKYGVEVITTRKDQTEDMELQARGRCARGCDLFLSIHSNAVGSSVNESVDYPVVYVPINGSGNELGRKLANCIASVMETKQNGASWSKRGGGAWDYYGVIYGATSVGVTGLILEHSFHTNTRSTKWLMVESNLDKLAKAEAEVLAKHFGLEKPAPEPEHWYRIRKSWDDTKSQKGAYKSLELAIKNCPAGYCVFDWEGDVVFVHDEAYTQKDFIMDIQKACGASVDGIAGPETLSKTVTLSAYKNSRHAAVKPVQERLFALGYHEVGEADGIAGKKFTVAVGNYQQDNGCYVDGEITAKNKTWRKLLGME